MRGSAVCREFVSQNLWYEDFYPNANLPRDEQKAMSLSKKFSKTVLEPLFFHSMAEKLDRYLMKKTYSRWMNMYGEGYSDTEFELAFRTHRGTSKNHDKNYQKKVLNTVETNVRQAISQINAETVNG